MKLYESGAALVQGRGFATASLAFQVSVCNVFGGCTDPGLEHPLLERLSVDYGTKPKLSLFVQACPQIAEVIAEPRNAILHAHPLLQ